MIRYRILLVLFFCLRFFHTGLAQQESDAVPGLTFSMQQAQDYAYEHNYDLKNSAFDVEIARKMVKQNTAIGLPQINGNIEYNDFIDRPTSLLPGEFFGKPGTEIPVQFGTKYNTTFKATLTQLVYSGQYLVGLQTAKAYLETVREKNLKDKIDVRDLVADAYIRVLVIEQSLAILDSTYIVVSKLVDEAKKSYQQGLIEDIDVDQADLNRSNLEAQLADLQSNRNVAYAMLKFLIGLKDNQPISLSDKLDYFLAQVDRDALINQPFNYERNIDYLLLKKSDYLILMQYKLAKTAYHPTLAGFIGISENAQRNSWNFFKSNEPWYRTTNWGLSLSIPIWSSGSRKYSVDQARLNVEKTKVSDEKLRVGLELQVETAKKDFNNAYFVYKNKMKGFETALKIYQKTMAKYNLGVSSSTDLNQRYTQFLQANSDYMQSMYTVLSSKIKLNKLLETF